MISLNNLANNPNMTAIANKGVFTVFEHQKDMSVSPAYASVAYFMHEMNVRKRQVLCNLNNSAVRIQAGAMQWAAGQVESETGVKGVGDFIGKAFKGAVTNESAVKPIYRGSRVFDVRADLPLYHFRRYRRVGGRPRIGRWSVPCL